MSKQAFCLNIIATTPLPDNTSVRDVLSGCKPGWTCIAKAIAAAHQGDIRATQAHLLDGIDVYAVSIGKNGITARLEAIGAQIAHMTADLSAHIPQ